MLIIRLRRIGKKNKPTYRVVVAEHTNPVDGKFTADLGFYNPHTKKNGIKTDEAKRWMDKGAKPSNTVARLLQNEKVKHKSVVVETKSKKPKSDKAVKAPASEKVADQPNEEASEVSEEQVEAPTESQDDKVETEETTDTAPSEDAPKEEATS